ncbi:methyl-accepting chemotaxis protein [Aliagarivorans marinus]|uniref:methyl-accepting chemotaxis protein n=1 Tax=Aliagarivorans marinus TaxID=561965 RepID=UPI000423B881|nr:methyl-accepting chemotaxis protein [Aliagarivorans marinus]
MSISKKLLVVFSFIGVLMFGSAGLVYWQITQVNQLQAQVSQVQMPIVAKSNQVESQLQLTLSSLRAHIIHGADPAHLQDYVSQLMGAWQEIELSLDEIAELSGEAMDDQQLAKFRQLRDLQFEIAQLAHTDDSLPAHSLLRYDLAPLAEEAMSQVSSVIQEELSLPGISTRKTRMLLVANMSEARNELANALTALRSFILSGDSAERRSYQDYMSSHAGYVESVNQNSALLTDEQARLWQQFVELVDIFTPMVEELFDIRGGDNWDVANYRLAQEVLPLMSDVQAQASLWSEQQQQQLLAVEDLLEHRGQLIALLVFAGAAVALLVGGIAVMLLSRQISSSLAVVNARAEAIAAGDLSQPALAVTGKDEVAQLTRSINIMSEHLKSLIDGVGSAVAQVSRGADSVAVRSQGIASELGNQRGKVEQSATAIEQLSLAAKEIAENTSSAAEQALRGGQVASDGGGVVEDTITIMQQIESAVQGCHQQVSSLSQAGAEVENITEVISAIAEQTNLLALNAAIEAARAGEQGRGFAVVADEVRNLARRTSDSTDEISEVIARIRELTSQAQSAMDHSSELVEQGRNVVAEAGSALREVITTAGDISDRVNAIASATEEQSMVAGEVANSLEVIAHISQQSASEAQASQQLTDELEEQVGELNQQIGRFVL